MTDTTCCLLTHQELYESCKYWQKVLRLEDWLIDIYLSNREKMPVKNVNGCCEYNLSRKTASIYILSPILYPKDVDMEQTLIHEILHILFSAWDHETVYTEPAWFIEQPLNFVTDALLKLLRESKNTLLNEELKF